MTGSQNAKVAKVAKLAKGCSRVAYGARREPTRKSAPCQSVYVIEFSFRRPALLIAVLSAMVLLTGGAALGATMTRFAPEPPEPHLSSHMSASGSQFASSLFTKILIPTGAKRVAQLSQRIKQAVAPIVPTDRRNLIDVAQEFLVPESDNVGKYLDRHQQPTRVMSTGIVDAESATGSYHYNYLLWCPNRHVAYCDATYSVMPVHGMQELRIDVQVLWVPIRPVFMPTSGIVTLTGFRTLSEFGQPVKSVSVVLTHTQAVKLRRVIASLQPTIDGFFCSLDATVFKISIAAREGGPPIWSASAHQCPGVLYIDSSGKTVMLDDHLCSLHQLVSSFLPAATAVGTTSDLKFCVK
jgi:hypothetical protein